MAQQLLYNLGMSAHDEKKRRGGMAQVVKPDVVKSQASAAELQLFSHCINASSQGMH
jgi:hypothetical protein